MKKFACTLQLLLLNLAGAYLIAVAWMNGWLEKAYMADPTMITPVIYTLFAFGVGLMMVRAWQVDRRLADPDTDETLFDKSDSSLQAWFRNKIRFVTNTSHNCITLGLIGTVVGFILSLDGIDITTFDLEAMKMMVNQMISGASVAFYTTVTGSIAYLWLETQINLYNKYAANLYQRVIDDA